LRFFFFFGFLGLTGACGGRTDEGEMPPVAEPPPVPLVGFLVPELGATPPDDPPDVPPGAVVPPVVAAALDAAPHASASASSAAASVERSEFTPCMGHGIGPPTAGT
jgi:hypothetical protein